MRLASLPASLALLLAAACASAPASTQSVAERHAYDGTAPPPPPPAPWAPLIGEYGTDSSPRILAEYDGQLRLFAGRSSMLVIERQYGERVPVERASGEFKLYRRVSDSTFAPDTAPIRFARDAKGAVAALVAGDSSWPRLRLGPESGNQLVVTPVRPLDQLRREAMAATPPAESGSFRAPELVELTALDTSIHLEIRYATGHNLFGTPFYSQARAFLQRPAAEALARASAALRARGFGLLVHDGYRPWYVTKMFWDAAPPEKHLYVADPAKGSRHNRGCAVDLTLYDLRTGAPVEMPSTYDETTIRAAADYPGGTSRQRWHRALLRRALESQGFTVNPDEWWHFDYRDWRSYRIMNVPFEALGGGG